MTEDSRSHQTLRPSWRCTRPSGGHPAIARCAIHWLIVAGSFANNSNSHNQPGALNPDLPVGSTTRRFFVRPSIPGIQVTPGNLGRVNGSAEAPIFPQTGWNQHPGTLLSPTTKLSLPIGYQTKWIRFANAGTPTPWEDVLGGLSAAYSPFGLTQSHRWWSFSVVDDEGIEHEYFNTQAVLYSDDTKTTDLLRSNLQVEYR